MWRSVPVLKLALAQMQVQMENCQDAGLVVAVFPGMPSFRANSVAPSVPSPPVAGKTTHLAFILFIVHILFCCIIMSHIFLSQRSSPGEARESHAVEGERLGKRVRKKRKIYMDSGDEEEENQEEPEVRRLFFASLSCIHPQSHRTLKCSVITWV